MRILSRRVMVSAFVVLMMGVLGGGVTAQEDHGHGGGEPRPELDRPSPIALNPDLGSEVGPVYQAFLSPHQQGGEEEDTPMLIPQQFRSTTPSVPRAERPSRGHAVIEFTNDFSRAYVHLAIADVALDDIIMLHLHCGRPGQLGPIIVDFSVAGDVNEYLSDGMFSVEITNSDLEAVVDSSDGLIGAFTAGCPIVPDFPSDRVQTISGLEYVARQGELYFNLHTTGQTYFGDIRGRFLPVQP